MIKYVVTDAPIGRVQIRFPRTKKRRIRKKWAKRERNWKNIFLSQPLIDESTMTIYCTSRQREQMRALEPKPTVIINPWMVNKAFL